MTQGRVPAPGLRETAEIWWDAEVDPVVVWEEGGRSFVLENAAEPLERLALLTLDEAPPAPEAIARALAEGLAACDFPPTADGPSPARVLATLRAQGVEVVA